MPADPFSAFDLVDYAGRFLEQYRDSGGRGVGLCKLHDDTRPSLSVSAHGWHCFGCHAKGNILDFFTRIADMSKSEAVEFVKAHAGTSSAGMEQPILDLGRIAARVHAAQQKLADAAPYLSARGIDDRVARDWQLGAVNGRLVIPCNDENGQLQGVAERALQDQTPKYKFPVGMRKSELLFGLDRVRDDDRLVICEGFFDCIALNEAGTPAVALGGTDLSDAQADLLKGREVIVAMDGDEPGRQASARIVDQLHAAGIGAVNVDPGDNLDPDDRTRRDGNADWVDFGRGIPAVPEAVPSNADADRPSIADVISTPDLMGRTFESLPDIISPFWPHGGQGIVSAQFGSYKTAFLQTLSRDLARGHRTLPGWTVDRPYKVLYVDFELPLQHIQKRFASVLGDTVPPENLYWLSADSLFKYGGLDLGTEEGKAIFTEILTSLKPDVVIVESVIMAFSSHNPAFDPIDAQGFMRFVSNLRLSGFACVWSAHTPKAEGPGLAYGSNFQNTGLDFIHGLSRRSEEGVFDLKFLKQRWVPVEEREKRLEIRFEDSGTEILDHGYGHDSDGELLYLIHERKPRTQAELATIMGNHESTAGRRCKALRNRGLILERSLILTEKGFLHAGIHRFEED